MKTQRSQTFWLRRSQAEVHRQLQGYNAAIIAYGQTGTGKTFTMEGERDGPGAQLHVSGERWRYVRL